MDVGEQWVKQHKDELKAAYLAMVPLIEQRAAQVEKSGRLDYRGRPYDELGRLDEWENDAKYCLAMAVHLDSDEAQNEADASQRKGNTTVTPLDLREYEEGLRRRRKQRAADMRKVDAEPTPYPEEAMRSLRIQRFMQKFTQREAEALILVEALLMEEKAAARIMGISVRALQALLFRARSRFGVEDEAGD